MPSVPPIGQTQTREADAASRSFAILPVIVLVGFVVWSVILTWRFVTIAGLGEFGATYEPAFRILNGEWQYRDFIYTHPPLSHFSLAGLFAVFGPNVWVYSLHLYLAWIVTTLAGGYLARELQLAPRASLTAICAGAIVSFPAGLNGHAYSHLGIATITMVAILLLRASRDASFGLLKFAGAGIVCGLAVFVKQNNGIVMAPFALLAILVSGYFLKGCWKTRFLSGLAFCLGWLVGFSILFSLFCTVASPSEVYLQLITDGAQAKAARFGLLVRMIPRVELGSLNDLPAWSPYRRVIEIVLTLAFYAGAILIYRGILKAAVRIERIRKPAQVTLALGAALMAVLCLGSIVYASENPFKAIDGLPAGALSQDSPWKWCFPELWLSFIRVLFAVMAIDTLMAAMRSWIERPEAVIVTILVTAIVLSTIVSTQYYIGYAGPVVLVYMAYVLANAPYAARVKEMQEKIGSKLGSHSVLWLMGPGDPYSVYGGRAVFSVPVLYTDVLFPFSCHTGRVSLRTSSSATKDCLLTCPALTRTVSSRNGWMGIIGK